MLGAATSLHHTQSGQAFGAKIYDHPDTKLIKVRLVLFVTWHKQFLYCPFFFSKLHFGLLPPMFKLDVILLLVFDFSIFSISVYRSFKD